MVPFTRVPFWAHIFDPQPYGCFSKSGANLTNWWVVSFWGFLLKPSNTGLCWNAMEMWLLFFFTAKNRPGDHYVTGFPDPPQVVAELPGNVEAGHSDRVTREWQFCSGFWEQLYSSVSGSLTQILIQEQMLIRMEVRFYRAWSSEHSAFLLNPGLEPRVCHVVSIGGVKSPR